MSDPSRLILILGMLGSSHDGEVLNAARAAQKWVRDNGQTWAGLLSPPTVVPPGRWSDDDMRAAIEMARKEGYQAGYRDGRDATPIKPIRVSFGQYAQELLDDYDDDLTEWEREFCEDWAQGGKGRPSPKQRAIFERLAKKTGTTLP